MNRFLRGPQGLMVVLAGVCALLAAAIAIEIARGRKPIQDAPGAPAKLADVGLLPGFTLPPADQGFPEVANRPLFVPTRRAAPPAQAAQANMPKGQFALLGTSVTKELGDVAMLKHLPTNKFHSVRKGEQVNGVTVESVQQDRVVLRLGDETEEVTMRTAKSSPVPPAPPPGMPGAAPLPPSIPNTTLPGSMPSRQPQPAPVLPSAPAKPSADTAQQLTPEQIIARRRAARAQQTQ
jgi:general secretion pathway protein N